MISLDRKGKIVAEEKQTSPHFSLELNLLHTKPKAETLLEKKNTFVIF